jgi:hypothetical protein
VKKLTLSLSDTTRVSFDKINNTYLILLEFLCKDDGEWYGSMGMRRNEIVIQEKEFIQFLDHMERIKKLMVLV